MSFLYRQEINIIRQKSAVLSGVAVLEYTASPVATLLSVITLVLTGQPLTPVNVFMFVAFINVLSAVLCMDLAYGFLETYDAYASLGRLEEFFLLEHLRLICQDNAADKRIEINRNNSNSKQNSLMDCQEKVQEVFVPGNENMKELHRPKTICVRNLTYKKNKKIILQDVEFSCESESLTIITGPVGSGKSTLLSTIAGEIPDTSGTVSSKGTLVYVPQIAWIFSGTVRENILFGERFDESKYTRIIEACALAQDIHQFPNGDQTIVGERGEVMSGGQRARVSLARAVYADADIYLLDDPLCAVDFKVGQHIFEKCIKGLLGQKTRVITSHQEHHMKEADNVIVLYKGRVLGEGGFPDLKEKNFLSATVDPLYKELKECELDNSFDGANEDKDEISVSCSSNVPQTDANGLQISEEDRTIGYISFKLYWSYFRSGVPLLVIFVVVFLCLITEGKPQEVFISILML